MSPITPPTLTRLDPAYPMLWRDVDTIQFGMEDVVRVPLAEAWVEPLLQALRTGFRRSAFDLIAHGVGAPREAARELLSLLRPVLREDPPPPPPAWVEALNVADPRCETRMRDALRDDGIPMSVREDPQAVGVVLLQGAASALQLVPYLRDDTAHLPVAFETGSVTIGPLVRPGVTPCLSCRDGHARDRDPSWPVLHSQLVCQGGAPIPASRVAEAAGLAARILRAPFDDAGSTLVRVSPDGRRVWHSVRFHEECRCRERMSRSPRGIETAPALLARPRATRTATAFARPA